ncbi:hypothetical protein GIB67_012116 [Kingdonia uniflora]|uniref:Uncharacterized protein n=1 Tax=Kingdonia uniflora TaxID=39325 RepID=A0A7J7N9D5_9MAGN|nr:hypothetical protein GIB67_012116 [Kingdonia uniflora]
MTTQTSSLSSPNSPVQSSKNLEPQVARPIQEFPPSYWRDHFLTYTCDSLKIEDYTKQVEVLKEEVRRMLIDTSNTFSQKMILIEEILRLGVGYHFEMEIGEGLQQLYTSVHDFVDLYSVSLHFRLLRQHGYTASCDVITKFKDDHGSFTSKLITDVPGMLSLYQATHLRTHGEDILDEALAFTAHHLKSTPENHPLKRQVEYALIQPYHKGLPRLEAKHYISFYGEHQDRNETLLKLAKLDFYVLRSQYLKELRDVTVWWKNLTSELPFVRDRVTEAYFWLMGLNIEPQYSIARVITVKLACYLSILDDTYDGYGTIEELQLLTDAIQRWDVSAIDGLPDYMKLIYRSILDFYDETDQEYCKKEGRSYRIQYAKEAMKRMVYAYWTEACWCNQGYVPTVEEYLSVAGVTAGATKFVISSFIGMGDNVTKESFDWVLNSDPQIINAVSRIIRVMDDITGYKYDQQRLHVASVVECYMKEKEYGVSESEACHELRKIIEKGWKDLNQCLILSPTSPPMHVLLGVLNYVRNVEVIYKNVSGYTKPHIELKDHIHLFLIDPVDI